MRADPVMSSFFVVCAAFPIQVRLYRGACAEYRNDALIGELEQRNRELADLSTTDALSGAQNRRGFEDSGADWMEGAGPSVALILFAYGDERFLRWMRWLFLELRPSMAWYGWAFYFGRLSVPVETEPWPNVCIRCGAGHAGASLKVEQGIYSCPNCGTQNFFSTSGTTCG